MSPLSLRDLRPCAICGGPLTGADRVPIFHMFEHELATVRASAVNEFAALWQFFGGEDRPGSAEIAAIFSPGVEDAVQLGSEISPRVPGMRERFFVCHDCYVGHDPKTAQEKPRVPPCEWRKHDPLDEPAEREELYGESRQGGGWHGDAEERGFDPDTASAEARFGAPVRRPPAEPKK